jgi:hypothetical protein
MIQKGAQGEQFVFSTAQSVVNEAIVPKEKLAGYSLNLNHETGKHKAKVFRDLLGIEAVNWRYLAQQLVNGLAKAKVYRVRKTTYGIQYYLYIPVLGLNGKSKTVLSSWIIEENCSPRLTSAYIADTDKQLSQEGKDPLILPDNLRGKERWAKLFELANSTGQAAVKEAIPTPMFIKGYPPVLEGSCGDAYVTIPDARKGFARWLRDNGIGSRNTSGRLIYVHTDDQSIDKAEAYAKSFAKVLQVNGVKCSVETYLD